MLPAPTFISNLVEVKESPIAGNGLFSKVFIPAGTCIALYKGTEMLISAYKKSGGDYKYCYSLMRQHKVIDGRDTITENPSHYCNESLTPNCILKKKGLYTLIDVEAGSELFLTYPPHYKRDYSKVTTKVG
jgi:SET domain-containing protein